MRGEAGRLKKLGHTFSGYDCRRHLVVVVMMMQRQRGWSEAPKRRPQQVPGRQTQAQRTWAVEAPVQ